MAKSVDRVLKSLSKAIGQLDVVANQQAGFVSNAEERIRTLSSQKEEAQQEKERADRVRARLEELLS